MTPPAAAAAASGSNGPQIQQKTHARFPCCLIATSRRADATPQRTVDAQERMSDVHRTSRCFAQYRPCSQEALGSKSGAGLVCNVVKLLILSWSVVMIVGVTPTNGNRTQFCRRRRLGMQLKNEGH